ncbi:MAG: Ig-like domain repeat protein [Mesorhizobium sp.]|uniref:Ig-like domain repeat protein n=1 Tax=Mesorhizobium sp. TaxID=1871066 RepID=UPI001ACCC752|nr:Ig-like domain repeat protein [Mesorhizobium sp.]MBN9221586.1 Ig-like domain repeat protein [Mesorhizobium sp.]
MANGLKAARDIRALFEGGHRGAWTWLGRLFVILGALFLPARMWISQRIAGNAQPRTSKRPLFAALAGRLPDLGSLAGSFGRKGHAVVLALSAILILLSPIAARAADGDGCNYLKNNPTDYDNGAYVITAGPVTRAAPPGGQTGITNYALGTVLYYSYTVSDPSITARLTYSGLSGLGIDIVPATSTGGNGSFTLPVDARAVTPSATIPGSGPGGTVTWTVYCGVQAKQAIATASGTIGSPMNFTPVTASFGRGTYTYALSGGTLPTGLSFNTGTGAITGTPTAALTATTFTVTVTTPAAGSASQTFLLTVSPPVPTVTAVSPASGPTGGGNSVTITGTGFSTANATGAVLFGATQASYTIDSNTQITATAPAGTTGTVDITVTTPGGTSTTSAADHYTYLALPTVTAISPTSGPTAGGTSVTITGSGFLAAPPAGAVTFGGNAATYTIVTDTQITATSPAGTAGTVDVIVTTPGGTSATSAADQFTYVAAPTISASSPASGPTAGGTGVTLTGTNLTGATLTVGGASVTPTGADATTVTFTTPAHAAGAVSVVVTTPGGSASTSFTYVAAPVGSSFTASAVAYNATAVNFSVAGHVTNSPTSYAVGSATTANGGSVSVNSAGLVTYSAPTGFRGNDSFTFTATNLGGTSSPATVTVPVSDPALTSTLTGSGTRGTALSGVQINTTGGRTPHSCSTTPASGALPAGTQLNSNCSISGTPEASGAFIFTAEVTDSSMGTGPFTQLTGSLTLSIAAPTIGLSPAAGSLPGGTVGTGYSQSFTANGGTSGYGYASTSGTLPPGLTLAGNTLAGTPTATGTFDFDITATDSSTAGSGGPYTVTQSYKIVVGSGTQTISFDPLSNISLSSTPPPLSATASSGLTVAFASTTPAVCTVSGTTVTLVDLGLCSITASQAGDADWSPASDVLQSFTVTPATLVITPAAATGLQVGVAYSQANTASGGLTPYSYALNAGAFVPGTSLNPATGTVSGTPTVAGSFSYIVQVTDSQGPSVTATTPVTTVTIAKGNQTIGFTSTAPTGAKAGGASYTIAASSTAGLGVSYSLDGSSTGCEVAGDTVTFTSTGTCVINADQPGDSNWNPAPQIQQSFAVGKATPTLSVSASDSAPTLGASVTFTAELTASASPTGTVTFKDGSTTIGTGTISGTTATYSTTVLSVGEHTITAEYAGDTENNGATSAAITVTVAKATPTLAVSASDSAPVLGASVTFTAELTGGASPTGTVTFKDGSTTLGTRTISGTTATYSTTALTVGGHSITAEYAGDADNADATSAAITVTVAKAVPTLTVSASDSAPAFAASVTFTAELTGGASPTGTVTFKDGSTTLGTGTISGTTATYSTTALTVGGHSITAEYTGDANNAVATSAAITVTVAKAVPTLTVSASNSNPVFGASVTFTAELTGGTSPTGTVTFTDGSTTLGTGTVSGTTATYSTASLSVGGHSITAEYTGDADNAAVTSSAITVTVKPTPVFTFSPAGGALKDAMAGEDYSQPISATGGNGTLTYSLTSGALPQGMTLLSSGELTGPLDAGAEAKDYNFTIEVRDGDGATGTASYTIKVRQRAVTVTDKSIDVSAGGSPGNVNLEVGATGGPFTSADLVFVEPANAGTASIVLGEFAALGPTPLAWYLKFVPNPAYSGTAKVGFTLTSALGVSNTGTVTYKLGYDAAEVTDEIDSLVHGFVRSRQSMISSTIKVPGLLERRRMENATDPLSARMAPSETGFTGSFSSSLAQLESARDNADGASGHAPLFNIWIDSTFMLHHGEQNDDNRWGNFAMVSLGADYLLSEKALVGLSFHYDRMTDPTNEDAKLTGNGWLAGPYASFEIGKGVFWDTSLLYGGSANNIDTAFWDGSFDTKRWMVDTSVTGEWQLGGDTVLTPRLRALYFSERVDDYAVKNAAGDTISLEGFDEEQFRVSLAAEVTRSFTLGNDMVFTPKLGVTGGFSGLDGSGAFGSFSAGLALQTQNAWMIDASLLLNIEGDGQQSVGAKAGVSNRF